MQADDEFAKEQADEMLKSRRSEVAVAYLLMAPFVVVYGVLFVYPTVKMAQLSFTDAPLIGPGQWVGFRNFVRLSTDRLFSTAIWNTAYFVLLSVIPGTLLGLVVAVGVNRLKGWLQSRVLRRSFSPVSFRVRRLPHLELNIG